MVLRLREGGTGYGLMSGRCWVFFFFDCSGKDPVVDLFLGRLVFGGTLSGGGSVRSEKKLKPP